MKIIITTFMLIVIFLYIYVSLGKYAEPNNDSIKLTRAAIILILITLFSIEMFFINSYYTSGKNVDVINKEYGTNYTQEDMFYSRSYINQIIKNRQIKDQ